MTAHSFADDCDILILGAGAAGLMAALEATVPDRLHTVPHVILADAGPVTGRKMRLAGGGMGNLTNLTIGPEWYVSEDPSFVRPALRRFPPRAALGLLERYGLHWEERDFGQIFGLQPMARLVEAMTADAKRRGVQLRLRLPARQVVRDDRGRFAVTFLTDGESHPVVLRAAKLILALGSSAWPSCGATDAGLSLAKSLGHACIPFRPVLVPLVLPDRHPLLGLQGLSVEVGIEAGPQTLIRPLLFTHRGLSGPAGLIASCFWRPGQTIYVDFLPRISLRDTLNTPSYSRLTVRGLLRRFLSPRLAGAMENLLWQSLDRQGLTRPRTDMHIAQWGKAYRDALIQTIHHCPLTPVRTEGMAKAEAAAGGVRIEDVNPRTLESCRVPGLFLAGELLDITGLLGGFNIHWALASGLAAGLAARRSLTSMSFC